MKTLGEMVGYYFVNLNNTRYSLIPLKYSERKGVNEND
jgi:hypothetical protein